MALDQNILNSQKPQTEPYLCPSLFWIEVICKCKYNSWIIIFKRKKTTLERHIAHQQDIHACCARILKWCRWNTATLFVHIIHGDCETGSMLPRPLTKHIPRYATAHKWSLKRENMNAKPNEHHSACCAWPVPLTGRPSYYNFKRNAQK